MRFAARGLKPAGLLLLALAAGCASPGSACRFDLGPIASCDRAPDGNLRIRALGPVFERQVAEDGKKFTVVRPFYARVEDPERKRLLQEYLWPVGMRKNLDNELDWRFVLIFGHDFDVTNEKSKWRFYGLPFVFAGRDQNGKSYFAIFPLAGKVNEFFSMDEITFFLFPLYMHSKIHEMDTYDYLWPLISRSTGGRTDRFRVLPFYGKATHGDDWVKKTVMWPFWNSVKYNYPNDKGGGFILFPIMGHIKLDSQETWMVVPPLFRWSTSTKVHEVNSPWPIYLSSSGAVKEQLYLWPLWGSKKVGNIDSSFLLWPVCHAENVDETDETIYRLSVLPFTYYESKYAKPPEPKKPSRFGVIEKQPERAGANIPEESEIAKKHATARYFKLWPLFSYRRAGCDKKFQAIDLWPGKQLAPVERNMAPYWTPYISMTGSYGTETEVLWGMYRRQENADGAHLSVFPFFSKDRAGDGSARASWSVLYGLLGCEREGLQKTWRLLYLLKFKTGKSETE
jgi:hypothetical protein